MIAVSWSAVNLSWYEPLELKILSLIKRLRIPLYASSICACATEMKIWFSHESAPVTSTMVSRFSLALHVNTNARHYNVIKDGVM